MSGSHHDDDKEKGRKGVVQVGRGMWWGHNGGLEVVWLFRQPFIYPPGLFTPGKLRCDSESKLSFAKSQQHLTASANSSVV